MLRRSPDPYEVEDEIQHDKGFGGYKQKSCTPAVEEGKLAVELFQSNDNDQSPLNEESPNELSIQEISNDVHRRTGKCPRQVFPS